MKQKYFISIFSFLFISYLFLFSGFVCDARTEEEKDLPEKGGIYNVYGRPDLKLRVFVHGPKINPARPKPTPTATPAPNCSLSDPQSNAVSGLTNWHLPTTFKYYLNVNSVPSSVGSQNITTITNNSFNVWTSAIGNKVSITKIGQTAQNRARFDGQNIIAWGKAPSGTLGITYIWSYGSGLVAEADTIMNQSYPWKWSNPASWGGLYCAYSQSYDAQNILTHELGHWIGVNDDYEDAYIHNTMYGYGSMEETKKDTLTIGDINAATLIYPN